MGQYSNNLPKIAYEHSYHYMITRHMYFSLSLQVGLLLVTIVLFIIVFLLILLLGGGSSFGASRA